jgi:hypothetical protein
LIPVVRRDFNLLPEFDLRLTPQIKYVCRQISGLMLFESSGGQPQGRRGVAASARKLDFCIAVAIAACWTQSALALDPRYPDWPCQQLKVPGISIANVWTGPAIEPTDTAKPIDANEADLVSRLAARRTPIEDARKLIADYVVGTDAERQQKAKTLFAALYVTLDSQRDQVMNGIERFSRKQKAMADNIRAETQKLREMQDKAAADQAPNEELVNQLAWQTRIFEDRRKSTSYVCDVPVLIEKRLFDLGKAIEDALNTGSSGK